MKRYKDRFGQATLPVKTEKYEVTLEVGQFMRKDSQIARFDCEVHAPPNTDPIALIQLALDEYKRVVESTPIPEKERDR